MASNANASAHGGADSGGGNDNDAQVPTSSNITTENRSLFGAQGGAGDEVVGEAMDVAKDDGNPDEDKAIQTQAATQKPRFPGAAEVLSSDDLGYLIVKNTQSLVHGTKSLQDRLVLGSPTEFLDLKNFPQPARNDALQQLQYSPFFKGLTTQSFLFRDHMVGVPNARGFLAFCFLPSAVRAYHDYPDSLKQMQLCHPAMSSIEMTTFSMNVHGGVRQNKTMLLNETGVTWYDLIKEWMRITEDAFEKGAPLCLTSPWSNHLTKALSEGHAWMAPIYKQYRGCLVQLAKLPASEAQNPEHFCDWDQDENCLKEWYELTAVNGQTWFHPSADAAEQWQKIKRLEEVAAKFKERKSTERAEKALSALQWLKLCLERKCAASAATAAFSDVRIVENILDHVETRQLMNVWRVNLTTNHVFNADAVTRKRLALKVDGQPVSTPFPVVMAAHYKRLTAGVKIHEPANLSNAQKKALFQKLKFHPLCGKLATDQFISRQGTLVSGGDRSMHKLFTCLEGKLATPRHGQHRRPQGYVETTASGMYLTKPVVNEVHVHLPTKEYLMHPKVELMHELRAGYDSKEGRTCYVDGIRTELVCNEEGVTPGNVARVVQNSLWDSPAWIRGLPICITVLGDVEAGAKFLDQELQRVRPIFERVTLLKAKDSEDYMVWRDGMHRTSENDYEELHAKQYVYYSQLLAGVRPSGFTLGSFFP